MCNTNPNASSNASDVHTENANGGNIWYANTVEVFFQVGRQATLYLPVFVLAFAQPMFTSELTVKSSASQVQEKRQLSIPCTCLCAGLVHTCFSLQFFLHLHARLFCTFDRGFKEFTSVSSFGWHISVEVASLDMKLVLKGGTLFLQPWALTSLTVPLLPLPCSCLASNGEQSPIGQ